MLKRATVADSDMSDLFELTAAFCRGLGGHCIELLFLFHGCFEGSQGRFLDSAFLRKVFWSCSVCSRVIRDRVFAEPNRLAARCCEASKLLRSHAGVVSTLSLVAAFLMLGEDTESKERRRNRV